MHRMGQVQELCAQLNFPCAPWKPHGPSRPSGSKGALVHLTSCHHCCGSAPMAMQPTTCPLTNIPGRSKQPAYHTPQTTSPVPPQATANTRAHTCGPSAFTRQGCSPVPHKPAALACQCAVPAVYRTNIKPWSYSLTLLLFLLVAVHRHSTQTPSSWLIQASHQTQEQECRQQQLCTQRHTTSAPPQQRAARLPQLSLSGQPPAGACCQASRPVTHPNKVHKATSLDLSSQQQPLVGRTPAAVGRPAQPQSCSPVCLLSAALPVCKG